MTKILCLTTTFSVFLLLPIKQLNTEVTKSYTGIHFGSCSVEDVLRNKIQMSMLVPGHSSTCTQIGEQSGYSSFSSLFGTISFFLITTSKLERSPDVQKWAYFWDV